MKKKKLENIVEVLKKSAIKNENGLYWLSPSLNNTPYLGISHGNAMIINFLSKMVRLKIKPKLSKLMINKGISLLLSEKRSEEKGLFPHYFDELEHNISAEPTQFSMCYGDLGIAFAILKASKSLYSTNLKKEAISILSYCNKRKKEDNLTDGANVIYGASGVACMYEEIYNLTKKPIYRKKAIYWANHIKNSLTLNGNELYNPDDFKAPYNDVNYYLSFGWGISGIGTTLIKFSDLKKYPSFTDLLMIF